MAILFGHLEPQQYFVSVPVREKRSHVRVQATLDRAISPRYELNLRDPSSIELLRMDELSCEAWNKDEVKSRAASKSRVSRRPRNSPAVSAESTVEAPT